MSKKYTPTIGLEIHAELCTATKMFCRTKNDAEEQSPNTNVCPVCLGYPGSLPTLNKEAIKMVLSLGVSVGGKLADYTEFDRKNYFYPDIPKGYQISQYAHPLVRGGSLMGVDLTRIHLEEDTARSTHDTGDYSLLDFNRAGVPLMELVTEPVIHDAETASKFAKELQLLLTHLGASHANMEKGEMRVEANISVSDTDTFGTKVEVKNLNSFKAVEKAIMFEIKRQTELLEGGNKVAQETRGWDESKEVTYSQRVKEDSHDYRYFPDPDLPKMFLSEIPEFDQDTLRRGLPELPWRKRKRYLDWGMTEEASEVYTRDIDRSQAIDELEKLTSDKNLLKLASNYLITDPGTANVSAQNIFEVMQMVIEGSLSSTNAKFILKRLENKLGNPKQIATDENLLQTNNIDDLKKVVELIIAENPKIVSGYKDGNVALLQFLIGQGMKHTKGSGNPQILRDMFIDLLK
ncbi:MAG: aspartyl/glutamyl-tRNA(Asn/Gln) amidotransferase, B subunit [Parcubacteria bacterium C7867-005]|nr:MAG: aspartyl/glutamyl-tRNA(Asn/Gln) amidotransferase, B subunit [Parcubacteria bacterium C7867-005]